MNERGLPQSCGWAIEVVCVAWRFVSWLQRVSLWRLLATSRHRDKTQIKKSYLNVVSYRLAAADVQVCGRSLSMSAKEFGPYGLVRRQYRCVGDRSDRVN